MTSIAKVRTAIDWIQRNRRIYIQTSFAVIVQLLLSSL